MKSTRFFFVPCVCLAIATTLPSLAQRSPRRPTVVLHSGGVMGSTSGAVVRRPPPPSGTSRPSNPNEPPGFDLDDDPPRVALQSRFGAARTFQSLSDADPEVRLQAVRRLALLGTPEGAAQLVRIWEEKLPVLRDPRALLSLTRGLATRSQDARSRAALIAVCSYSPDAARSLGYDDQGLRQLQLAREIGAFALAKSQDEAAVNALVGFVRARGAAQSAASLALQLSPPRKVVDWGTPSAPLLDLIATLGDLRALPYVRESLNASDPLTRAAALRTSALLGDERVLPVATQALTETSPDVRAAATEALLRLHVEGSADKLDALLKDPRTNGRARRLVVLAPVDRLVVALGESLQNASHPEEARELAGILGQLGSRAAAEALGRVLLGKEASVQPAAYSLVRARRFLAAQALATAIPRADAKDAAQSSGDAFESALLIALTNPDSHNLAALALAQREAAGQAPISSGAREKLRACAQQVSDPGRASCATASLVGHPELASFWLTAPDVQLRRVAAQHLANGPKQGLLLVRNQLRTERDPSVALGLRIALLRHAPELFGTPELRACEGRGDADAPYCAFAKAFAARRDEAPLREMLASRDVAVQLETLRGLTHGTTAVPFGAVAELVETHPSTNVRKLAASILVGQDLPVAREAVGLIDLDPRLQNVRRGAARDAGSDAKTCLAWALESNAEPGGTLAPQRGTFRDMAGRHFYVIFDPSGYALVPNVTRTLGARSLAPSSNAQEPDDGEEALDLSPQ